MKHSSLQTLLEAARLAPSGDNTQPWRFELSPSNNSLRMALAPERDTSPMNAANNMARIAIGAALENMYQAASRNQWQLSHQSDAQSITVRLAQEYGVGSIPQSIQDRASNRKEYDGVDLPQPQFELLRQAMEPDGTQVVWINGPADRAELSKLIAQADSMILSSKQVRQAFLEKVRFDQPVMAEVDEGLSLGSLEISAFERTGLRLMPYVPDALLRHTIGPTMFYQAAHKLAASASGFCVITSDQSSPDREYEAGRLFQRGWVALADQKLAAQPMMSLLVLQNMIENLRPSQIPTVDPNRAIALLDNFRSLLKRLATTAAKPMAMLRFGQAEAPSVRTARLSLDACLEADRSEADG